MRKSAFRHRYQTMAAKWVVCIFILNLYFSPVNAQYKGKALVDTGTINGAAYRIDIPANWNRNLVLYAHGYNSMSLKFPLMINSAWDSANVKMYTGMGFALARSEYRKPRGWALPEGVEDTEALREYFVKKYGKPDSAFITGHSMGGGITLATIERYPQFYAGAMPMCPLSSGVYAQTRQAFDMIAVFNVMYPGTLPSLGKIMSGTAEIVMIPAIAQKITTDSLPASRLARLNEFHPEDLPLILMFMQSVLKDLAIAAGGNPFDNTNTVYAGYGFDLELNQKIERISSSKGAEKNIDRYNPTGNLNRPVVIVHTVYDQLINPTMGVFNFDNQVQKTGKSDNLVVFYTSGQGHCEFSMQETATAFEALRKWASTGVKPKPGKIP